MQIIAEKRLDDKFLDTIVRIEVRNSGVHLGIIYLVMQRPYAGGTRVRKITRDDSLNASSFGGLEYDFLVQSCPCRHQADQDIHTGEALFELLA